MLAQLVIAACSNGNCSAVQTVAQPVIVASTPQTVVVSQPLPQIITTPVVVSSVPASSTVKYKRGLFGRLKPVSATVKTEAVCQSCK